MASLQINFAPSTASHVPYPNESSSAVRESVSRTYTPSTSDTSPIVSDNLPHSKAQCTSPPSAAPTVAQSHHQEASLLPCLLFRNLQWKGRAVFRITYFPSKLNTKREIKINLLQCS